MSGATDLDYLLKAANPQLDDDEYVFVCRSADYGDYAEWQPLGSFLEKEGMTFIIRKDIAQKSAVAYEGVFKRITLQVHSSLEAVGLTARFAERLTAANVSANVVAAFYHDHIFVPLADADRAMTALSKLDAD